MLIFLPLFLRLAFFFAAERAVAPRPQSSAPPRRPSVTAASPVLSGGRSANVPVTCAWIAPSPVPSLPVAGAAATSCTGFPVGARTTEPSGTRAPALARSAGSVLSGSVTLTADPASGVTAVAPARSLGSDGGTGSAPQSARTPPAISSRVVVLFAALVALTTRVDRSRPLSRVNASAPPVGAHDGNRSVTSPRVSARG